MKPVRQRILSALLGTLCAAASLSAAPISAGAAQFDSARSIKKSAQLIQNPANRLTAAQKAAASALPSSYDLRNVDGMNFVTPVKNQQLWGSCWAFGGLAAAEASAQFELYRTLGISPEEMPLDFSELQLAWFAYTALQDDDPDYPSQSGEGIHYDDGVDILNNGGMRDLVISLLASGIGPFGEDAIPYINKSGNALWVQVDENGHYVYDDEGYIIWEAHPVDWDAPDNFELLGYNIFDEDWSVDAKNRFKSQLRLEHANQLPCPAIYDSDGNYYYDADATNTIKSEIVNGRAVEISFCADSATIGDLDDPPVYLSDNYAHYTDEPEYANHSVCIVGYDDNYSASNFLATPPGDGAFIVKNSWGNKDSEIPGDWGIDDTGYFYLSYYDMSLDEPTSYDFMVEDLTKADDARRIDQYDLLPNRFGYDVYNMEDLNVSTANIFTASKNEYIEAVSTYVYMPGMIVDYQIYRLNAGYSNPTDGTLVASGSQQFTYAGFHAMRPDVAPAINAGESYSIVTQQRDESGNTYLGYTYNYSKELIDAYNASVDVDEMIDFYAVARVNPGESFLYSDGDGWLDETDFLPYINTYDDGEIVIEGGIAYDNNPIKGYAAVRDTNFAMNLTFDRESVNPGEEFGYTVTITNNTDFNLTDIGADINATDVLSLPLTALAPGESMEISGTRTPSDADVANGKVRLNLSVHAGRDAAWISHTMSYDLAIGGGTVHPEIPAYKGDMNRDGEMALADVILALQLYTNAMLGTGDLSAAELDMGDVNMDGAFDLLDVVCILQYYNYNAILGMSVTWNQVVYNEL